MSTTLKGSTALKSAVQLAEKIQLKKSDKNIETTEKAVQKIHSSAMGNKRVTIDFPDELYTEMKMKTFKERITLREYILSLVQHNIFQ